MLRLAEPGQSVSYINLGQWWYAPGRDSNGLFLNDDFGDEAVWVNPEEKGIINNRIFGESNKSRPRRSRSSCS
ncbi:hypothetical protein CcaCcLH18_10158 [Colletotrichum camelliae]|nr:hypothetical protein CcaCcLH18_10158 [Colletotrichum camelliae]